MTLTILISILGALGQYRCGFFELPNLVDRDHEFTSYQLQHNGLIIIFRGIKVFLWHNRADCIIVKQVPERPARLRQIDVRKLSVQSPHLRPTPFARWLSVNPSDLASSVSGPARWCHYFPGPFLPAGESLFFPRTSVIPGRFHNF
jgi:hypothetical protein